MSIICPTVTPYSKQEFDEQLAKVSPLSQRLHLDLMDGDFAKPASVSLEDVHWPSEKTIDLHIMYEQPTRHLDTLIKLKPNMVIVHAESHDDLPLLAAELRKHDIKMGLALLVDTPLEQAAYLLPHVQHVLIFSGSLGSYGGHADFKLLDKVQQVKQTHRQLEIGWDGGITDEVALTLVRGGVDVLNVGGFFQHSSDPQEAYAKLEAAISLPSGS